MSLEVKKYRFTKLVHKSYPSGYVEGEVVELPVLSAVGCPWWIPVDETKHDEAIQVGNPDNVAVQDGAVADPPSTTGGEGGSGIERNPDEAPQMVNLMFPPRKKPAKKAGAP